MVRQLGEHYPEENPIISMDNDTLNVKDAKERNKLENGIRDLYKKDGEIWDILEGKKLSLEKSSLGGARSCGLEYGRVLDSYFLNCDFKWDSFENAEIKDVSFKNCNFIGVDFKWAKFDNVRFDDCKFPWSSLVWVDLSKTEFYFSEKES